MDAYFVIRQHPVDFLFHFPISANGQQPVAQLHLYKTDKIGDSISNYEMKAN
jgi:hypothetical protein